MFSARLLYRSAKLFESVICGRKFPPTGQPQFAQLPISPTPSWQFYDFDDRGVSFASLPTVHGHEVTGSRIRETLMAACGRPSYAGVCGSWKLVGGVKTASGTDHQFLDDTDELNFIRT